jgi:hypothetical protein
MKDIYMYRKGAFLAPASPMDAVDIQSLPEGVIVSVNVIRKRSNKQERFLRALVAMVADGIGQDRDLTLDQIKFSLGMIEPIDVFGEIRYRPKSTSRDAMPSQEEYNAFVNRVIELVQSHYLPGIKKVGIVRQIEKMLRLDHHVEDALS